MLTFQPLTQEEDGVRRFPGCAGGVAYIAYSDQQEVGSCLFCIDGELVEIRAIHTARSDPPAVTEGLLRAALGYASRRGAFRAVLIAKITDLNPDALGFRKVDGRYEADIYDVLTSGGCSCGACPDVAAD
jgi:hypothetical protein